MATTVILTNHVQMGTEENKSMDLIWYCIRGFSELESGDNEDVEQSHRVDFSVASKAMTPTQSNPLHLLAVGSQSVDVAKRLLAEGLPVDSRNKYGETALHWNAQTGNIELGKFLLDNRADINAIDNEQNSVLHWAVEAENKDYVRFILSSQSEVLQVDKLNSQGETALQVAVRLGNKTIAEHLRRHLNFSDNHKQSKRVPKIMRLCALAKHLNKQKRSS